MYLGNGGFLTSLLLAGLLACVVDRRYKMAGSFALVMAGCAAVGMIHCPGIELLSRPGIIFGVIYLTVAIFLFSKSCYFESSAGWTGGWRAGQALGKRVVE